MLIRILSLAANTFLDYPYFHMRYQLAPSHVEWGSSYAVWTRQINPILSIREVAFMSKTVCRWKNYANHFMHSHDLWYFSLLLRRLCAHITDSHKVLKKSSAEYIFISHGTLTLWTISWRFFLLFCRRCCCSAQTSFSRSLNGSICATPEHTL